MKENQEIERKFVKPGLISENLKCPICLDVFVQATRLFCGHTLCAGCLNDYMKMAATCPECRTKIDSKNIGIDLLAREIINELQVFCPVEDCPWKGLLQELDRHWHLECSFMEREQSETKKKKNKNEKTTNSTKIAWQEMVDDEVRDKINENIVKGSLEARILAKTSSLKTTCMSSETISKGKEKKKNERNSDFNFLESLFG